MIRTVLQRAFAQQGKLLSGHPGVSATFAGSVRHITKSTENEMNVDYMTFREQVSPMVKDKKYNMKKAQR